MKKFLESCADKWLAFTPNVYECTRVKKDGVRSVFYDGINGTRVFAFIGLPENASKEHPVPAMVLVHGGLGTAFSQWVRYWNEQGFAAISMDTCGALPLQEGEPTIPGDYPRHEWSGPKGWGAMLQGDWDPEYQWFTHAESAIMFGHNLLRSMPEIDPDRIGITGVSWGAVLTLIAAGIDPRYKAVVPVYGNGFLHENNRNNNADWQKMESHGKEWWDAQWDPQNFISKIKAPVLWFASSNDWTLFYPDSWEKSTELIPDEKCDRCMKIRWPHAHGECSEKQPEIFAFCRQHLMNGTPRTVLQNVRIENDKLCCSYTGTEPFSVTLSVTRDRDENWFGRYWDSYSAAYDEKNISARLPADWVAAYITLTMADMQTVTSKIVFRP